MKYLELDAGWVALMCGLYLLDPLEAFWPFLAAMAVHELGHAMALWAMNVPIRCLRLSVAGAAICTGGMNYRQEILCALAGPAMNLLMLTLRRQFPVFCVAGLLLAGFNLLPIFPLDGGRALRAVLLLRTDEATAAQAMKTVGLIVGCGMAAVAGYLGVVLGAGLWPMVVAALLLARVVTAQRAERNCGL